MGERGPGPGVGERLEGEGGADFIERESQRILGQMETVRNPSRPRRDETTEVDRDPRSVEAMGRILRDQEERGRTDQLEAERLARQPEIETRQDVYRTGGAEAAAGLQDKGDPQAEARRQVEAAKDPLDPIFSQPTGEKAAPQELFPGEAVDIENDLARQKRAGEESQDFPPEDHAA